MTSVFLSLNGCRIPVAVDGFREIPANSGEGTRVANGRYTQGISNRSTDYELTTPLLSPELSEVLRSFVEGRGFSWSFDADLFSSDGLGPLAGGSYSISTSEKKFGAGSLLVSSGSSVAFFLGLSFIAGRRWTASVFKRTASGIFTHYAIDDAGVQYKNGLLHTPTGSDDVEKWLSVDAAGVLTLLGRDIAGVNSTTAFYDQLVVVPYRKTKDMLLAESAATSAFASLPALSMSGECISDDTINVLGEVADSTMRRVGDGTLRRTLRITLHREDVE